MFFVDPDRSGKFALFSLDRPSSVLRAFGRTHGTVQANKANGCLHITAHTTQDNKVAHVADAMRTFIEAEEEPKARFRLAFQETVKTEEWTIQPNVQCQDPKMPPCVWVPDFASPIEHKGEPFEFKTSVVERTIDSEVALPEIVSAIPFTKTSVRVCWKLGKSLLQETLEVASFDKLLGFGGKHLYFDNVTSWATDAVSGTCSSADVHTIGRLGKQTLGKSRDLFYGSLVRDELQIRSFNRGKVAVVGTRIPEHVSLCKTATPDTILVVSEFVRLLESEISERLLEHKRPCWWAPSRVVHISDNTFAAGFDIKGRNDFEVWRFSIDFDAKTVHWADECCLSLPARDCDLFYDPEFATGVAGIYWEDSRTRACCVVEDCGLVPVNAFQR